MATEAQTLKKIKIQELEDISEIGALLPGDVIRTAEDGYGGLDIYQGQTGDEIRLMQLSSLGRRETISVPLSRMALIEKGDGIKYLYFKSKDATLLKN